jgi:RNA polymerase sigma-70 factor (ECF subfamily)
VAIRQFGCNFALAVFVIALRRTSLPAAIAGAPDRAEPEGLEKLFIEHQSRIWKAAYRITGSAQDAEDVLQTVFLRLARREETALPQENLASYLYRAGVNASLDLLRGRRRAQTVGLDDAAEPAVEDGADSALRVLAGDDIRARLRRALGRLNPRHAEIFTLRYIEDWANQDIARALGMSRITVNVVLHRVRHRLRKDLRQMKGSSR